MKVSSTIDLSGAMPCAKIIATARDVYSNIAEDVDIVITTDFGTMSSTTMIFPDVYTATLTPDDWCIREHKSGISSSISRCCESTLVAENFTVPVYVHAPSKHGIWVSTSMNILSNSSVVNLVSVADGDLTDGFPTPNVEVKDNNTIMIYQANSLNASTENVHVANLTFNPILPNETSTIKSVPEIYLNLILSGVPMGYWIRVAI